MRYFLIKSDSPYYPDMEALYVNAFPADERRDCKALRQIIDANSMIHCLVITDDREKFVGFINYWTFTDFCYIEHFAVEAAMRGSGIGSKALRAFADACGQPLVLEVELPNNDFARRRIAFYRRCGFDVWHRNYIYVQPPYSTDSSPLQMLLMARPVADMPDRNKVVTTMHREVYGIMPT